MNVVDIIGKLETALKGRSFENSAIAVGQDLFIELRKAGKLRSGQVVLSGSPATHAFDTYEGRFMITRNPNMPIDAFRVGP